MFTGVTRAVYKFIAKIYMET